MTPSNINASKQKIKMPKISVKTIEDSPYVVDCSKLGRFSQRNIIFERVMWDSSWKGYEREYDEKALEIITQGKPGYSRADFALSYASWIVHDAFEGGFSWNKIKPHKTPVDTGGIDWTKTKHEVDDPHKMSNYIKRAATLFGASLLGSANSIEIGSTQMLISQRSLKTLSSWQLRWTQMELQPLLMFLQQLLRE